MVINLNVIKAHGWDKIFIKHCGKSIAPPLSLILQFFLNDKVFPSDWKKVILSHIIKKAVKT